MVEYGLAKEPNETQYPLVGPGLKQADDAYRELEENVCVVFLFVFYAISLLVSR